MSQSSADAASAELGPGSIVGKYRLIARLGEGGMGVVYSAVHERLGRQVAIKVLLRGLSENADLASRFQMEAELVTRIGHPNIVAVYDFGRLEDGRLYYVMEMVKGESLRGRMQNHPLTDQEIMEVYGRLLSALRAAHDIGVVHRDLKPDNVMLELTTENMVADVKLLDFGIAKIRDEQPSAVPMSAMQGMLERKDSLATAAGAIMGTPAYMSPEQIKNSSTVDRRSDVYAVGIMLYEALAGQRPFSGASSAELLGAHLYQQAIPPSEMAKTQGITDRKVVWSKLNPVVLRAIAKEPAERYQDCAALLTDLEAAWGQSFARTRGAVRPGMGSTVSLSGIAPVVLPGRRRKTGVLIAGLLAAVALGGGGVYALRLRSAQKQAAVAQHIAQAQALFAKAQAGEPSERRMLMESIEAVGSRAHLPAVAKALGDDDPGVWRAALQAALLLAQPGDTVLAEPLQILAGQEVGPIAVDLAAARLRIGETEALAVLTAMLQSPIPTPEARLRAALALAQAGQLKPLALRQALEAALRAGTVRKTLRREALVRLAVLHDPEALSQLKEAAQSSAPAGEQQTEALQVLALAKQPQAEVNLRLAAEVARGSELLEQASVIAELGDRHAAALLSPLIKDSPPKVRQRALAALCRLAASGHFPGYTQTLLPLLNDSDPQVALIAAVALLGVGPFAPVPAAAAEGAPRQ